jgi:alkanesulfonate monooxygenase SsuD/methylene tetrahydromethanopterin reductase-like flavin-dependent oxidoreductase (luciferase family)
MRQATHYYREQCALYGWEPTPEHIIYRGNILLAESDAEAQEALQRRQQHPEMPFPMRPAVRDTLAKLDSRNIAGVPRPAFRDGALPTNFVGSPETVVKQIQQCHDEVGAGVLDLAFQSVSPAEDQGTMRALELFGKEVLPRIREM